MAVSSVWVSSMPPLPWETRWTVTPRASASPKTASIASTPSTLGISTRYAAPSGKRFVLLGSSPGSVEGSPSERRKVRDRSTASTNLVRNIG